ncbi:UNVERIFIED_CONTAM: hypothetical protein FKN15_048979 [Acipenser sinensis]
MLRQDLLCVLIDDGGFLVMSNQKSHWTQDGNYSVKIHHIEYIDGGILDPDDVLADLVDDKDKNLIKQLLEGSQGVSINNITGELVPDLHDSLISGIQITNNAGLVSGVQIIYSIK